MFAGNRANFCIWFYPWFGRGGCNSVFKMFLNFSAIAAPSSMIAAFNIVVGALVGKWLHFGGCRKQ